MTKKKADKKANPEAAKKNQIINTDSPKTKKTVILLLSIIGAFFLWVYAIGYDSTIYERTFNGIDVIIEGESSLLENKNFVLAEGQHFSSVSVVATGKRSELNELDSTDFRAYVDVSGVEQAGYLTLDINIETPNGISVKSQSSSTVRVYIDEFTQRHELVEIEVETGNYVMTDGVTFVSAVANPLTVLVSGPASVLDSIDKAYVNFDLEGREISGDLYGHGDIELRDKSGAVINNPYVTLSETKAYVTVSVIKQKVLPVRVEFIGGIFASSDAGITVSIPTITVSGTNDALKGIDALVIKVDESSIDLKSELEFAVSSFLPSGVSNESGTSKITVNIELPKLAKRVYTIPARMITVENLPNGASYNVKSAIDVNLIGPRDAFDAIDRDLLSATVDFDDVRVNPDGSYTAKAVISLGADYEFIYVQNLDYEVTFTIN